MTLGERLRDLRINGPAGYSTLRATARAVGVGFVTSIRRCQCCGKELHLAFEPRSGRLYRSDPDAPSVDRVNNRKGYTRQNIAIICWQCNFRKSDLALSDLAMFARYIEQFGDTSVV